MTNFTERDIGTRSHVLTSVMLQYCYPSPERRTDCLHIFDTRTGRKTRNLLEECPAVIRGEPVDYVLRAAGDNHGGTRVRGRRPLRLRDSVR